ncbi:hypothetical protein ABFX02_06G145600 [Erythranthe guttata]
MLPSNKQLVRKRKNEEDHLNRESILNQTDVSLSLAKHIISGHSNLVTSPLSIQIVLSMVAAGSNDPTRNQILRFLKEIVRNAYVAASSHVDFQTKANEVREEVNTWAEKETKGLIKNILPFGSVDALTRLIFTNAVYFKGIWDNKFDTSMTRHREFFLLNGSSIEVPYMTGSNKQYISEFDGFKVLRMPYKQGKDYTRKFSMYFFLPDAKDGLMDLLDKFASESRFIENHIPQSLVKVGDFRIPKFKIGFDIEASKILKGLGVGLPFRMGSLTEMVDSTIGGKLLCVAGIFQKAFIEVNEHGTEAAAATATATRMGYRCAMTTVEEKRVDFVADRPFLFIVREDISGVVVFIGQLLNPPSSSVIWISICYSISKFSN